VVEPFSSLKADVVKMLAHPGRIPILEMQSDRVGALERSAADT